MKKHNKMEYTFNIYTAKQLGCYDMKYWVVCEETSYLIGADTKKEARLLKANPELWEYK
mgnify:CR=1 FL=1